MQRANRKSRVLVHSLGLIYFRRARRILNCYEGHVAFARIARKGDRVAVWGRKNAAKRGIKVAQRKGLPLISLEDSFMRSLKTGRQGEKTIGIITDSKGIYYSAGKPNELHAFIQAAPHADAAMQNNAKIGLQTLIDRQLSKYNATLDDDGDLPNDYVLVVDQTQNDAAITYGGADDTTFAKMLEAAKAEHPDATILIKSHPETVAGKRLGFFDLSDDPRVMLYAGKASIWRIFRDAKAVYTVTSQIGMEAIFAGHRPVVFGKAFYAGWGLSDDRHPAQPNWGKRTAQHLFQAAYLNYSKWYDPFFDRASDFFQAADLIHARRRAFNLSAKDIDCVGFRLWKRSFMRRYLGFASHQTRFVSLDGAKSSPRSIYRWGRVGGQAMRDIVANGAGVVTVEDGFVRSRGLGARLVPPCSLIFDKNGIYYDPRQVSDLDVILNRAAQLNPREIERARNLIDRYREGGLSKYNLGRPEADLISSGTRKRVLVVGQVEDDASVQLGTQEIARNADLLWSARQLFPKDLIIYKPHPDVEAGLRDGDVSQETLHATCDQVLRDRDISTAIKQCDVLCTMTSLAGFEALIHKKKVICFGTPFYSGWGLTVDRSEPPKWRQSKLTLEQLVHGCLIDYPYYWDPVTKEPCAVETVIERFSRGQFGRSSARLTGLAKLQGLFATYAHLWR